MNEFILMVFMLTYLCSVIGWILLVAFSYDDVNELTSDWKSYFGAFAGVAIITGLFFWTLPTLAILAVAHYAVYRRCKYVYDKQGHWDIWMKQL